MQVTPDILDFILGLDVYDSVFIFTLIQFVLLKDADGGCPYVQMFLSINWKSCKCRKSEYRLRRVCLTEITNGQLYVAS